MKILMLLENIFQDKTYGMIIRFTYSFDEGKGLCLRHYRWGLVKNHGNIKSASLQAEMEKFFGDDLQDFYDKLGFTDNDYITSNSNLSNFLHNLVKKDIFRKDTIEGTPLYYFSKNGDRLFCMNVISSFIDKLDIDELQQWCDEITLIPDYFKQAYIRIADEDGCSEDGWFIMRKL